MIRLADETETDISDIMYFINCVKDNLSK